MVELMSFCALVCALIGVFRSRQTFARVQKLEVEIHRLRHVLCADRQFVSAPGSEGFAEKSYVCLVLHALSVVAQQQQVRSMLSLNDAESSAGIADSYAGARSFAVSLMDSFGRHLAVWIGGVAIILSGFFLVKYSVESGLLSPMIRVGLSFILAKMLLLAAGFLHYRCAIANQLRIVQALTGSAVAVLFAAIFAAFGMYQFLSPYQALVLLAVVTGGSLYLSLQLGMPVALLGLIGGYTVPALVGRTAISDMVLYLYLYVIFGMAFSLIRRMHWWHLSLPVLLITVMLGVGYHVAFGQPQVFSLSLFALAVCVTSGILSASAYQNATVDYAPWASDTGRLNFVSLGGMMLLLSGLLQFSGFDEATWVLFAATSIAGLGLATFRVHLYGFMPMVSLCMNGLMLWLWHPAENGALLTVLTAFAMLYLCWSGIVLWSSALPLLWAGVLAGSSLGFYLLAYGKLSAAYTFSPVLVSLWGLFALVASAGSVMLFLCAQRACFANHDEQKQSVCAVFAGLASTFFVLACVLVLDGSVLPIAVSLQMVVTSWLCRGSCLRIFCVLTCCLAAVYGLLLWPQALRWLESLMLVATPAIYPADLLIAYAPVLQLAIPAVSFLIASKHLHEGSGAGAWLADYFERIAVLLSTIMVFFMTRQALHDGHGLLLIVPAHWIGSVVSNVFFVWGCALLALGRILHRPTILQMGLAVIGLAVARLLFFDVLIGNPLWTPVTLFGWGPLTTLLVPYALPLLWTELACMLLQDDAFLPVFCRYARGFECLMVFVLVNLYVRYAFHGAQMHLGLASHAELYTYSLAWLLMAVGVLLAGIRYQDLWMRRLSSGLILLTVAKVFLYDAAALEGLYRVLSFLGLGLCLLVLSWLYARFVKIAPSKILECS